VIDLKHFSVYDRRTGLPICVFQTPKGCARALHISTKSFYRKVYRSQKGKPPKRYEIVEDKEEQEETC
jgi:hypothetical protein